jgi:3-oxo-5-alpha-steroid 4-dehydrogenase 1
VTAFLGGVLLMLGAAPVTFVALTRVTAPYGRHARDGFGPRVGARLGWVVMESPAVLVTGWAYALGEHRADLVPLVLLGVWLSHYLHRAFVYPWSLRPSGGMPVLVVGLGALFNVVNGWLNGRWLSSLGDYPDAWLWRPATGLGLATFAAGWLLNRSADRVLRSLRAPGETGYRVPRGGPYEWVSCPNYLGELVEWAGWALATASPAGVAFFLYTAANLVPRAASHHRWYRETFPDYPPGRKALVPLLW